MTNSTTKQTFYIDPISQTSAAKWSYFSLIFSGFYFFHLIAAYEYYTFSNIIIVLTIYALFIALFVIATRQTGHAALRPILAIIVLATLGAYFTPGTNALYGYAAFFSGYYFVRKHALAVLAISIAGQLIAATVFDLWSTYFLGPSLACSLSLFVYGFFSQKEYLNATLHAKKNQQIEQLAAIAERERIARDMHDLLGHSLSSLALKSELAAKLAAKQMYDSAQKEMDEVAELARQTLSEVRYAVTGLKQKGLAGRLTKLANELKKLDFQTNLEVHISELPAKVESSLIMLSKEWVTNILRHSKGSAVTILIQSNEDNIQLKISDNGHVKPIVAGNGIEGMRSRVAELNGTMDINQQHGVTLDVNIPLKTAQKVNAQA